MALFSALYCSILYRYKKVKSWNEGYVSTRGNKCFLLDQKHREIDSIFAKGTLQVDQEIDFENYSCLVMAKSSSEDRVQAESVLVEQRRNLISNNGVSSVSMQPGPKRKRMGLGKFSTPRQAKKLQSDLNTHHTVEQLTGCEATNGITCVHMLKSGQTVCLANDGSLAEPLVDNPQLDVDTPEKSAESECKIEPPALEYKPARKLMVLESTANQSVDHKICDDGNRALPANESATISLKLESNSNQYSCQAEITAQDKNARSRDELLAMFSVENED